MVCDIKKVAELSYRWEKLNNKTILMSGGTGFIGSFICDVIAYRNKNYGQNTKIISLSRKGGVDNETVSYLKQDIREPFSVSAQVDYVMHLASNTHPKLYAEDPIGTITTNIYGCDNLLQIAKEQKAKFLLASSVEIYGQGTEEPMDEKYSGYIDCNQARAGYNEAKRVCEALTQSYRLQYGNNAVIARLARIFGADHKIDTKAMAQFIDKAVSGEDIVLKSNGAQRFSYCYVADAASALLYLLLEGVDGEAYNITEEDEGLTLGGYAEYIASLAAKNVIYTIEDNELVSKISYALMDGSKLKLLGWKPLYTIKDGIKRTFELKKLMNGNGKL